MFAHSYLPTTTEYVRLQKVHACRQKAAREDIYFYDLLFRIERGTEKKKKLIIYRKRQSCFKCYI